MLKLGQVQLSTSSIPWNVVSYEDNNFNERMDIIHDIELYKKIDTSNCEASYIKGVVEKVYGDISIITTINRIKQEATFLRVPENKEMGIVDGKFTITISKEDAGINCRYKIKMVGGLKVYEYYETSEGFVEYDTITQQSYHSSDRPINYELYETINSIGQRVVHGDTVKVNNAEFYSYDELLRRFPQVAHVLKEDYVVVESYEEAVERLEYWINSKEQLKSIDIESRSTDWHPVSTNRITGVFLGCGEKWSTYFPFRQDNFEYNLPIKFLRRIFDAVNNQPKYPNTIILAHNAKFEIEGFYQEFREFLRIDVCTYVLSVLVNPIIKKGSHTLKKLTSKVDGKFYLELSDIFIGPIQFNVLPKEIVKLYGCPDATSPAKIYKYLMSKLPKDEMFVKRLEMGLLHVKAMNEFYGIRMDQDRLYELIQDEEYKVQLLGDTFRKLHKTSRNINSSDVLSEILYSKLKCKVEVRTDKGAPATSKYAIDRIVKTGAQPVDPDKPLPADILDRKGKVLIEGTKLAANKYPSLIIYQQYKLCCKELGALNRLKNKSADGRFLFYINQVGAGSNRQTSDAHQFSDTMKSCALADSPYHGLVSNDWKQVELRILAGAAGQKDLIELEKDMGVDIHRAILSIIQKRPMWTISEEDRKAGKSVNFGVVYMMTAYGLARRDFGPAYTKEQLRLEMQKITDFFNGLPMVKKYLKDNEEYLKKHGYIKTLFKYYRYFPELLDPTTDPKLIQTLIRSGNNTPIQGTGAQMLKIAETKVWEYIKSKGWHLEKDYGNGVKLPRVRMILPIHDEILLSYDEEIPKEEICKMFKECMELDIKDMPPFYAAPAFIDNWYQGKDAAYEVDLEFRDKVVEEYEKGNYLLTGKDYFKTLANYREGVLREYMSKLVREYKTPDEVAKHVTDDNLTHTLIETLPKDERKKLSHTERIFEATKRFMAAMERDTEEIKEEIQMFKEELEDTTQYMDIGEWTATYSYVDENGELIEEVVGEVEDTTTLTAEEEFDLFDYEATETPRVFYALSECVVDLTGLDKEKAEEVNKGIQQLANADAYYPVVYLIGEQTLQTPFKVPYIEDEIVSLFETGG